MEKVKDKVYVFSDFVDEFKAKIRDENSMMCFMIIFAFAFVSVINSLLVKIYIPNGLFEGNFSKVSNFIVLFVFLLCVLKRRHKNMMRMREWQLNFQKGFESSKVFFISSDDCEGLNRAFSDWLKLNSEYDGVYLKLKYNYLLYFIALIGLLLFNYEVAALLLFCGALFYSNFLTAIGSERD